MALKLFHVQKHHHSVTTMTRFLLVSIFFVLSYSISPFYFTILLSYPSRWVHECISVCPGVCPGVRIMSAPRVHGVVNDSDNAAGSTGIAPASERHGVVEGHGWVRGTELMGMIVRGRGRWQRGLRAVSLSDTHRCRHGWLNELMGGRALAEEGLHPPSSTLVHNNHLDNLLALDKCFWAEFSGLDGAEQSGRCSQGQRWRLNAGLAQLIGLQPVVNWHLV